jgi:hypothetical protein
MSHVVGRPLLAFLFVLIIPLAVTPAFAQTISKVSMWRVDDSPGNDDLITQQTAPTDLPGINAMAIAKCLKGRPNRMQFGVFLWPLTPGTPGDTFDVDNQTLLHGHAGAFGSVDVYGHTYKYIHYESRFDSDAWDSATYNATLDDAANGFSTQFGLSDSDYTNILGKSKLFLSAKRNNRPVVVEIDLNDEILKNYIQSCDELSRKAAQENEAEEKQREVQKKEIALANIEQQRTDKTNKMTEAYVAYLGFGPVPNDSASHGTGDIFFKVKYDVHGYMIDNAMTEHMPLSQLVGKPSGLIDPLIELKYVDSVFKDKDVIPAGTECVLIKIGFEAKVLLGKKYIDLHCRGFPEEEFIPVDAITYLHKAGFGKG